MEVWHKIVVESNEKVSLMAHPKKLGLAVCRKHYPFVNLFLLFGSVLLLMIFALTEKVAGGPLMTKVGRRCNWNHVLHQNLFIKFAVQLQSSCDVHKYHTSFVSDGFLSSITLVAFHTMLKKTLILNHTIFLSSVLICVIIQASAKQNSEIIC